MDQEALGTVPLAETHRCQEFACTRSGRVQQFIRGDCRKLISKNYTKVFIRPDPADHGRILGFYSLSAFLVQKDELQNKHDRHAPKGLPAPVALIGFMGKADGVPKGFGPALIHDAALRVSRIQDLGIWGLALDAENDALVGWYESVGFSPARPIAMRKSGRFMYGPLSAFL